MVGFNVGVVLRAPPQHQMESRDVDDTPEEGWNPKDHKP